MALSFAAEQRDYVAQVAEALKARGLRCFYGADQQARLRRTHQAEEPPLLGLELLQRRRAASPYLTNFFQPG